MNIVAVSSSALAAGLFRHKVAAGNIANLSTPGYQPRRVDLRNSAGGGVEAQLRPAEPPLTTYDAGGKLHTPPSSVDLAEEAAELLGAKEQVMVSSKVLQRAHDLQGSLLDVLA
jgi:hypothetical protein